MSILIKNIADIEKFKKYVSDNPTQPLCYVFYKNNMRFPNVHYVGFTNQKGIAKYHYLNNHHKMKNLIKNLNNGYKIQIYTKYSERSLITLFKPTLNGQSGNGMDNCRNFYGRGNIHHSAGEIIDSNYQRNNIEKVKLSHYEELWEDIINKHLSLNNKSIYNSINFKFINTLIEIYRNDKMSINDKELINDPLFNRIIEEGSKDKFGELTILTYKRLLSILTICRLDKIYLSYIIIHEIFKKNILWHLNSLNNNENKCSSCGKIYIKKGFLTKHIKKNNHSIKENWIKTINSSNNKYIICVEILEHLKQKKYLISNFNQKNHDLWFYYHPSDTYDAYASFITTNKQVSYSPYHLHLSIDNTDKKPRLVFIIKSI